MANAMVIWKADGVTAATIILEPVSTNGMAIVVLNMALVHVMGSLITVATAQGVLMACAMVIWMVGGATAAPSILGMNGMAIVALNMALVHVMGSLITVAGDQVVLVTNAMVIQ